MTTTFTRLALLAIGIAASGVTWHAASASGSTADLEVYVLQSDPTIVDAQDAGNSPGDWWLWQDPVFDADGNEIGTAYTRVQLVEAADEEEEDFAFVLDCTIELDSGNIVFTGGGLLSQLPAVPFAVVGGTGTYAGITGSLSGQTVDEIADQPVFRLPFDFAD
jgi:hypothetical protein